MRHLREYTEKGKQWKKRHARRGSNILKLRKLPLFPRISLSLFYLWHSLQKLWEKSLFWNEARDLSVVFDSIQDSNSCIGCWVFANTNIKASKQQERVQNKIIPGFSQRKTVSVIEMIHSFEDELKLFEIHNNSQQPTHSKKTTTSTQWHWKTLVPFYRNQSSRGLTKQHRQ